MIVHQEQHFVYSVLKTKFSCFIFGGPRDLHKTALLFWPLPPIVLAAAHVWKQTNLLNTDLSNMISGSIVLRNQTLTAHRFRVIAHRT